jgi:hypothetical protein
VCNAGIYQAIKSNEKEEMQDMEICESPLPAQRGEKMGEAKNHFMCAKCAKRDGSATCKDGN